MRHAQAKTITKQTVYISLSVNDGTTEQNTSGKNGLHANRRLPKTKDELTFAVSIDDGVN